MKRSSHLRLALMASALPAALTACDNPAVTGGQQNPGDWSAPAISAPAAASSIDCSTAELMRTDACKAELERILDESPRYGSGEECRTASGGECQQVNQNGQSAWVGPMTGFIGGMILANVIDEIGDRHRRGYRYAPYRGGYRGGYPANTGRGGYPTTSAPPPPPPPTRAVTQSRSGFGSTSSARRSFGGGWGG